MTNVASLRALHCSSLYARDLSWVVFDSAKGASYLIAVEYKQSQNGSTIKQGIGQSIMHTLCEDFHFVYYLFHDQNKDKRILKSVSNEIESYVIDKMWKDYNVYIRIV